MTGTRSADIRGHDAGRHQHHLRPRLLETRLAPEVRQEGILRPGLQPHRHHPGHGLLLPLHRPLHHREAVRDKVQGDGLGVLW